MFRTERARLLASVSYPVLNLVQNINHVSGLKDTEEYRKAQKKASNMRLWAILRGRPYQPMFG